jgi:hypothetical protein
MKVDQFQNARKTRKKAQQTFFSFTNKIGDDKKKRRSGKKNVKSFAKPKMLDRIQFRAKFKAKDVGMKK